MGEQAPAATDPEGGYSGSTPPICASEVRLLHHVDAVGTTYDGNLLIEGDVLHALTLEPHPRAGARVGPPVYIDPPFNTGQPSPTTTTTWSIGVAPMLRTAWCSSSPCSPERRHLVHLDDAEVHRRARWMRCWAHQLRREVTWRSDQLEQRAAFSSTPHLLVLFTTRAGSASGSAVPTVPHEPDKTPDPTGSRCRHPRGTSVYDHAPDGSVIPPPNGWRWRGTLSPDGSGDFPDGGRAPYLASTADHGAPAESSDRVGHRHQDEPRIVPRFPTALLRRSPSG